MKYIQVGQDWPWVGGYWGWVRGTGGIIILFNLVSGVFKTLHNKITFLSDLIFFNTYFLPWE